MTALSPSLAVPQLRAGALSDRLLMGMLIGFCFFSAALGRFCFLLRPLDNDAAIFIYMGKMVATGGRLCHDLIDNKFPTVGLMISILWKTLGTHWAAYVGLQAVMSLLTAILLGRIAGRVSGDRARLPTFLFALVFLNLTPAVYGGFQLETLQIFFTVLSAGAGVELILTRSPADAFVAGVAAGCGAMFKPTAVGVLLALCVVLFVFKSEKGEREDAKARRHEEEKSKTHFLLRALRFFASSRSHFSSLSIFFSMLAGLSIPIAFALLYLFNADLIADMPGLYRQISTYAHETVFDLVELLKPITALALLGFPIVIRGVVCRRQRDVRASSPAPAIIAFLLLWLAIETTGVILQRRMYAYHFLPMVPPAALLFGMLPRLNRPVSLAGALVPIAVLSIAAAANLIVTTGPGEARLPLSDYLQSHAKPGDAVWTDAWPRVVLETGLAPGTRLPNTFLFTNYDNAGLDYSAGMLADFERVKPAYIILPTSLDRQLGYQIDFIPELNHRPIRRANYLAGWHHIEQYTLEHYDRETTVGNDAVYHRRGS